MRRYLGFVGLAAAVAGATALAGWWPTRSLGGDAAVSALLAGCGVSWLASAIGGIPRAIGAVGPGVAPWQSALAAMALRLLTVVVVGAAVGLSGSFERTPLLLWIAISYLTLLAADIWYSLGSLRSPSTSKKDPGT